MKRRLVIDLSLLNEPKLLILYEPTTGLDPQVRHLIWDKLRQLKKQGTTILLTTHYMEEAFQLCDTILIMHKGKNIMQGAPAALLESNIEKYVLDVHHAQALEDIDPILLSIVRRDDSCQTPRLFACDINDLKPIADSLEIGHYHLRESNLEDVFLKATGRTLNVGQ